MEATSLYKTYWVQTEVVPCNFKMPKFWLKVDYILNGIFVTAGFSLPYILSGMGGILHTMHVLMLFKHCAMDLYSYRSTATMLVFLDWHKQKLPFKIEYYFHMFLLDNYVHEMLALIIMVKLSHARFFASPLVTQKQ